MQYPTREGDVSVFLDAGEERDVEGLFFVQTSDVDAGEEGVS